MPGLHFDITASNENFKQRLAEVKDGVKDASHLIQSEGESIDNSFSAIESRLKNVGKVIGAAFTTQKLFEFGRACIDVRAKIQSLEKSFTTLLGNEAAAASLIGQIRNFAATTPMDVDTLSQGAQTMLGFNIEAQKVMPMLKAIGDISMGDAGKFQSLSLAFSQMSATGKLMGQDLLQMINAGFNPLAEIANKTGKSIGTLKKEMEGGKISVQMVTDAFISATSEGGKFHNMLKEQAEGLNGAFAYLNGTINDSLNEIGSGLEGIVTDGVKLTANLVRNYKAIGEAVMFAVAGFGAYKAALMVNAAIEVGAIGRAAALAIAKNRLTEAVLRLNAAISSNAWGIAAGAVVALSYGVYKLVTAQSDAEKAQKRLNDANAKCEASIHKEQLQIEILFNRLKKAKEGTEAYAQAKESIMSQYGTYLKSLGDEKTALKDVAKAYELVKEKAKAAAKARAMDSFLESENNSYAEDMGEYTNKVYNLVKEKYGEDFAQKNLDSLRDITEGNVNVNKDFLNSFNEYIYSSYGTAGSDTSYMDNALDNILTAAKKRRETYDNIIKEAEIKFGSGSKAEDADVDEVKNKEYWKKLRDAAQTELEALSDIEAKGAKGAALKAKINAYNAKLSEYEVDKNAGKKAATLKEKQLNAQIKLGQELAELQRRNDAEQIAIMDEGVDKKLRQIDNEYTKRRNEIAKQEAAWRKENKTAGLGSELTDKQKSALAEASELNEKVRQKSIGEVYQAEFAAMRENLQRYGLYQQQKLAITEEYAERIKKAGSEGERRSLAMERDSSLAKITTEELKANIDWQVVFGEFGGMFRNVVAPVLDQAKAYVQTDEFENADHDSQQALIDAIRQMEQSAGKTEQASFKKLGQDIEAYQKSLADLQAAQEKYRTDYEVLTGAQRQYTEAMKSGTPIQQAAAQATLNAAQANVDASAQNVEAMQENADAAKRMVTTTATTLKNGMDEVLGGIQKLASGSASGAYEGLISLGKGAEKIGGKLGQTFGKISKLLEKAPIIGWIASIIDILKDGLSDLLGGLIEGILSAVGNIVSDVITGDFAVTLAKSLYSGISNILDTLTFGGLSALFDTSNGKEVQDTIDRLTMENKALEAALGELTDTIKAARGTKSVSAYRDAYSRQQAINQNYLEMAMAEGSYHGAHHSWNATYEMTDEWISAIRSIKSDFMGDIFTLSPEEMKKLRDTMPGLWRAMLDSGEYTWRVEGALEDYIAQAGKLGELTDNLREAMTGMSFDSMYDSFISSLSDMEWAAEDAADNVAEMFYKAMLANTVGQQYYDRLKEWYDSFADAMKDGLQAAEVESLQAQYAAIVDEAIAQRDAIAAVTGYDPDAKAKRQQASAGGFESLGEDTGKELNGRFTAVAESNERIAGDVVAGVAFLMSLTNMATECNATLSDLLTQAVLANSYLEDIAKHTKPLLKMIEKLDKIIANTD